MKSAARKLIPSIVVFLIGLVVTIVGALFKIQHWPYGSEILVIGNFIEVVGVITAIFVLIKLYKSKN